MATAEMLAFCASRNSPESCSFPFSGPAARILIARPAAHGYFRHCLSSLLPPPPPPSNWHIELLHLHFLPRHRANRLNYIFRLAPVCSPRNLFDIDLIRVSLAISDVRLSNEKLLLKSGWWFGCRARSLRGRPMWIRSELGHQIVWANSFCVRPVHAPENTEWRFADFERKQTHYCWVNSFKLCMCEWICSVLRCIYVYICALVDVCVCVCASTQSIYGFLRLISNLFLRVKRRQQTNLICWNVQHDKQADSTFVKSSASHTFVTLHLPPHLSHQHPLLSHTHTHTLVISQKISLWLSVDISLQSIYLYFSKISTFRHGLIASYLRQKLPTFALVRIGLIRWQYRIKHRIK